MADWSSVYVLGDGSALSPRLVVAHRNSRKDSMLSSVWPHRPPCLPDTHPHLESLRTGSHVVLTGEWAAARASALSCHQAGVETLQRMGGLQTILTVPLIAHGAMLGSIMLVMAHQPARESDAQRFLEMATELAESSAQAIHNARLYREAKLAVRRDDQTIAYAAEHLLELLANMREHSDGIREYISRGNPVRASQVGRGLAQIELLAREMEHLTRELNASVETALSV
jgi:GAF domain-containing protein